MAYVAPLTDEEEGLQNARGSTAQGSAVGGGASTPAIPQAVTQTSSAVSGPGAGGTKAAPAAGQAGAAPTGGGTATTGTGQVSESTPSSTGLFNNLQAYLAANPNGGAYVGSKVSQPITTATNTGTATLNSANQGFNQAVNQGTDVYNSSLENQFVNNPANFLTGYEPPNTASTTTTPSSSTTTPATPTSSTQPVRGGGGGRGRGIASDAIRLPTQSPPIQSYNNNTSGGPSSNLSAFENMLSGTYSGPSSYEGSNFGTVAQNGVQNATQESNLANTAGGQQQLLQNANANNATQYTQGGLNLDQFLLGASPTGTSTVQAAQQGANNLAQKAATSQTAGDQAVTNAQTASTAAGTQAKQGITSAENALATKLQNQATTATNSANTEYQNLQTLMNQADSYTGKSGQTVPNATPQQLAQLGITSQQWANLINQNIASKSAGGAGINFASMLTPANTSTITAASQATPEEIANYNALNQMVTGSNPNLLSGATGTPGNPQATFNYGNANSTLSDQVSSNAQAAAQLAAINNQTSAQQTQSTTIGVAGGAIAGAEIGSVFGPVGTIVGGVIGAIVGLFCFAKGTQIVMIDGSTKAVEDLELGDETYLGGLVCGAGQVFAEDLYTYKGTIVEGAHTVFEEDGVWRRVKDSKHGAPAPDVEDIVVYPIVTANNVYIVKGDKDFFVAADMIEVNDPEWNLNLTQRLEMLNAHKQRNELILAKWKEVSPLLFNVKVN